MEDGKGPPQDVNVLGGDWSRAVLGTKVVNKNTIVHNYDHGSSNEGFTLPPGHFNLHPVITVTEMNPISTESRIHNAKLRNCIFGDIDVAIKILNDGERQRREAEAHYKVPRHKNIVERIMIDSFKYMGRSSIYIAMEQCDPLNLYAYVTSQAKDDVPFDAEKFMSFAHQIGVGLEFLHSHNIANRNLKPHNILLSTDKQTVKIADFGLSEEIRRVFHSHENGWHSPEVLNKAENISLANDIFLLGLVFHFLWSYGGHPFGDDPDEWNLNIKRGEKMNFNLKVHNAESASSLLKSMLEHDPETRPTALEVVQHGVFKDNANEDGLHCDRNPNEDGNDDQAAPPPVPRRTPKEKRKAVAIFNYESVESDEISFEKGDIITDIDSVYENWWLGTLKGKRGLLPSNYVKLQD